MIKPRIKSIFLILLREANIVVTVITAISILYLRSIHSLWFGIGTLVATATAKLLKKVIKQPRPTESTKKTYGMPSTHSSSISFFGVYLFLSCLLLPVHERILIEFTRKNDHAFWDGSRFDDGDKHNRGRDGSNYLLRTTFSLMFVMIAAAVCWSRVKLGHHTPKQVFTGAAIGGLIAWIWFGIWTGFKIPRSMVFSHPYYPSSTLSTNPLDQSPFIEVVGIGGFLDRLFDHLLAVLSEAWQMRDFGLIWDSIIRPALNQIGFWLGLPNPIFDHGLPPNSNVHPIKPHYYTPPLENS